MIFPQLASGALYQFPIKKRHTLRTVVNEMEDGRTLRLADPGAESTEWDIEYENLSDSEAAALLSFFTAMEGSLGEFTFLDPAGNLLAWSGDLGHAAWEKAPLITVTEGVSDPAGGKAAWQVENRGAGEQTIAQTITAPGDYTYCFSVYARAAQAATLTLRCGTRSETRSVGTAWTRIALTGSGAAGSDEVRFAIALPSGASVSVYGAQSEAQVAPSVYKPSTTGGVYEYARFREDSLLMTATDDNRHKATVKIIHVNHL